MISVSSAGFLKEFSIYCNKANDENETIIVTRSNDKNIVVLSLEEYNQMNKQIFELKNKDI